MLAGEAVLDADLVPAPDRPDLVVDEPAGRIRATLGRQGDDAGTGRAVGGVAPAGDDLERVDAVEQIGVADVLEPVPDAPVGFRIVDPLELERGLEREAAANERRAVAVDSDARQFAHQLLLVDVEVLAEQLRDAL